MPTEPKKPKIYILELNGRPYKWADTGIKALAIARIDKLIEYTIVEWEYDEEYDNPSNVVRHLGVDHG